MMYDFPPAYVAYEDLQQFEVSFTIKKPRTIRSKQVVSASSSQNARDVIYAQYGKANVTNLSVREVSSKK
jgi:hypothetical protein